MLFEVFTTIANENEASKIILSIEKNVKGEAKKIAKQMLSDKSIKKIKKIMGE